ncbi:MAG: FAD-binding oxidoreductase [Gordonia sp. (in: high G+C Gram-positive bacteria)]|uniref:FAD-binding oxidoreductase n=1 Tax=Gordonia sp. (in: high G+C Gram-positive bacteria) TaxID=84139 RepID=UPI0039E335D6
MTTSRQPVLHRLRDRIDANSDLYARNVFARLFAASPGLRDHFPVDMTLMRAGFLDLLDHVLEVLPGEDGHTDLIELLAQYGRDNRKYGYTDATYDQLCQILITESAAVMGPEWTAEAADTVGQAMLLTTGVMRGAAQSVEGPPTWQAQVVQKFAINRDRAVIRLKALDGLPDYQPGQYVETMIPQCPNVWRDLSPALPPNAAGEMEFHVRAITGGEVSPFIVKDTQVGDVWSFAQAHGTLHVEPERPVLMLAGGSGLAPLRALLLEMAHRADSPPTHLYYGARFPGELYDLGALSRLAATNPWLTVTGVVDETADPWWVDGAPDPRQWGVQILAGPVGDVAAASGDWRGHQVLIAGPPGMIDASTRRLLAAGVPPEQIQHDPVHDY